MKSFFQNLTIALVSTIVAYLMFINFYVPEPQVVEKEIPVALVSNSTPIVNSKPKEIDGKGSLPQNFVGASERVTPCVVNITTLTMGGYRSGSGSGVIVSENGYIITNNHVIENSSSLRVSLNDKRNFTAEVVGVDPTTDLALLKVDAQGLLPITFGNSDQVRVGEWVLAVGNPFSLTSTVTAGIVSSKARNINILRGDYSIESFIQTDAVVNPGNSGGALVDTEGNLIGINTAILTESGNFEGYSFAIPSNLVLKVVNDLKDFGEVRRAVLGVVIKDVNERIARELNLPRVEGVIITRVSSGSSAEDAGLRSGDVIVRINGTITNSVPQLQEQVALFRPGAMVNIDYYREGNLQSMENVLLKSLSRTFAQQEHHWE